MPKIRPLAVLCAVAVTALWLAAPGPAVAAAPAAAPAPAISPSVGPAANGTATLVTITGSGFSAASTVALTGCSTAGAPALPTPDFDAGSGSLRVLVPSFTPSSCGLTVTTGATTVTAGTYTWSTSATAYVTLTALAPSLVSTQGGSFLLTGVVTNPTAPGDSGGLMGATAASLTCGTASIPATVAGLSAAQASVTVPSLTGVPVGTACGVTVTLASGNTVDSSPLTPVGVWVAATVPAITLSPAAGPENQADGQWIGISGTGLQAATAVTFQGCPAGNPAASYPAVFRPGADGTSLSVQVPDVPQGQCSVVVTLPADTGSGRPAGYSVASVPPGAGFTFQPPYQGPITLQVANTGANSVADADLWVSVMADASGGGGVVGTVPGTTTGTWTNGFAGVNAATLTSVPFDQLQTYDAATHTAALTLTPPLASGNLYVSGGDLTGAPPNPTNAAVRYAMAEFTYDASGLDTDLTLIDQIGFTLSSDQYADAAATQPIAGAHRDTGCLLALVNRLSTTGATMTDVGSGGVMRYSGPPPTTIPAAGAWTAADLGSAGWVGLVGASKSPSSYPSVQDYVTSVAGPLTIDDVLGDPAHGGAFSYTAVLADGLWTLTGTLQGGSAAGPKLVVEQAALYGPGTNGGTGYGVYGQDGPFEVYLPTGGTPTAPTYDAGHGWASDGGMSGPLLGWANTVKTVYRDLVAGFAYGYWGSTYGGGTDTGPGTVNFTRDPLDPTGGAYAVAQPTYPNAAGQYAWNVYDQVVRSTSNIGGDGTPPLPSGAYGMPYSDTFVPSALSPNQDQGWAYDWTLTVGDPAGCATTGAPGTPVPVPEHLHPPMQTVVGHVGVPLTYVATPVPDAAPATRMPAARPPAAYPRFRPDRMLRPVAHGFTGTVRYTLRDRRGRAVAPPAGFRFDRRTGVLVGAPSTPMRRTRYAITVTDGHRVAATTVWLQVDRASRGGAR